MIACFFDPQLDCLVLLQSCLLCHLNCLASIMVLSNQDINQDDNATEIKATIKTLSQLITLLAQLHALGI